MQYKKKKHIVNMDSGPKVDYKKKLIIKKIKIPTILQPQNILPASVHSLSRFWFPTTKLLPRWSHRGFIVAQIIFTELLVLPPYTINSISRFPPANIPTLGRHLLPFYFIWMQENPWETGTNLFQKLDLTPQSEAVTPSLTSSRINKFNFKIKISH